MPLHLAGPSVTCSIVLLPLCRMVFASGIVQACGQAAGEVASALASHWALTCSTMWDSLAVALEMAIGLPHSCLPDSMAAADKWAAETGLQMHSCLLALVAGYASAAPQECLPPLAASVRSRTLASLFEQRPLI